MFSEVEGAKKGIRKRSEKTKIVKGRTGVDNNNEDK